MNNPTRIKFRRYGRYLRSTACLVVAVVLLLSCLAGCSGEVYDPDRGTLTLPSSPSQDETGEVLELPEADPYGDSAHVLRADFLETGKSDAILLRVGDAVILVDTGETDDYGVISRCLQEYGISEIDYLVLTHFDNDHIGAAAGILQNYRVKTVFMPDYVRDSSLYRRMMEVLALLPDTAVRRVTEETTVEISGGRMVIYPTALYKNGLTLGKDEDHALEENNFSLITSVFFGQRSILLMGDAEKERIREFSETLGEDYRYDLIKIPHHGDANKPLRELLLGCDGLRYCVVHVAEQADVESSLVTAIQGAGAEAFYTYDGRVRFATDGESMTVLRG